MKYNFQKTISIYFVVVAISSFCVNNCESQAPTPVLAQFVNLWNQQNCAGTNIRLLSSSTNLGNNNFDNDARSVSGNGIWLFYQDASYAGEMEFDFQPIEQCTNFLDIGGTVSSVRSVGSQNNVYENSLTLYPNDWFRGSTSTTVGQELKDVSMFVGSIIITGNRPWMLYSQIGFQGNSVCVGYQDYNPTFICDVSKVVSFRIQSVRIECDPNSPPPITTYCNYQYV